MRRGPALALVGALLLLILWHCTPAVFDASVHTWGTYQVCLHRLSDPCTALDGGCGSGLATDAVTLGSRFSDGRMLWSRTGIAPIEGTQSGSRFELSTTEEAVTSVCGCAADVTETIRGELLPGTANHLDCTAGADGGCEAEAAPMFFDGGLPDESWVAGADAGTDPNASYGGFRAVVVDEVRRHPGAQPDGGTCECLPCRVVYEARGQE